MPLDATSFHLPETRAPLVAHAGVPNLMRFMATFVLMGSSAGLFLLLLATA